MELFKMDPGLAIWTWIVFGITFMILQRFVFPYLLKSIKDRERMIVESVDKASLIEKRLSDIEKEQAEMMKASKAQANEFLRQVRLEAEVLKKELIKKAEKEAEGILAEAKVKIAEERAAIVQSVKKDVADFVCDVSEKVIGRSFVSSKDHDWVDELVEAL